MSIRARNARRNPKAEGKREAESNCFARPSERTHADRRPRCRDHRGYALRHLVRPSDRIRGDEDHQFCPCRLRDSRRLCRLGRREARPALDVRAATRLWRRCIVRRLYQRPLDAILATWGLGTVIGQIVTLIFGREVQFVQAPITGTIDLFGVDYSAYRIVMIAAAAVVAVVFTGLLNGTRLGLSTRAVIMNE